MWRLTSGRLAIVLLAAGVLGAEVVLAVNWLIAEPADRAGSIVGTAGVMVVMAGLVVGGLWGARERGYCADEQP